MAFLEIFFIRSFIENIYKGGFVDSMLPARIFIRDIQRQLKEHMCTSTVQVYRSERISNEQFQQLKMLKDDIIAIKYIFLNKY